MILKRDNVEKVILDDSVAKAMLSKGWQEVKLVKEEKPKRSKKKSEDAE